MKKRSGFNKKKRTVRPLHTEADVPDSVKHAAEDESSSEAVLKEAQKKTVKKRMPAEKEKTGLDAFPGWMIFAVMPLFYIYEEAMLSVFTGSNTVSIPYLGYMLASACAFGILTALLISLFRKQKHRSTVLNLILYLSVSSYTIAVIIKLSFQVFMNPKSVFSGTGDAVGGFAGSIFNAIKGNILIILALFLPAIILQIINKRKSFVSAHPKLKQNLIMLAVSAALIISQSLGMASNSRASSQAGTDYDFNASVPSFGLITALVLDTYHVLAGTSASTGFISDASEEIPEASAEATPVIYGRNEMNIDFKNLADTTDNEQLKTVDQFIASETPAGKNEYTGIFKGKNLIFICAEAFSFGLIDPVITPTLYRLSSQGIRFSDYYQPAWGGSTTTGEYSTLTGLIPMDGVNSMKATIGHDLSASIGNQLQKLGYFSRAYHDNSDTYYSRNLTHENFGYEKFIGYGNGMEEGISWHWPCSDDEMMQWTYPLYKDEQPFSIYYMTVSGHAAYTEGSDAMAVRNLDYLRETFPSFNKHSEKVQCYLAANYELEKGLTYLLNSLEDDGILDDTVIVLTADHYPYGLEKSAAWDNEVSYLDELYGYTVEAGNQPERDKNTLIIWSGSIEGQSISVDDPVSSIDIIPTLSNLFGTEYDSRLYAGRDVFSNDTPLVMWMDRSWKTDLGFYNAYSGVFTPAEGFSQDDIPSGYADRIVNLVRNKFTFSQSVLDLDYYAHVFSNPDK
ncbi:MAG: alkaline phosphatase family protein [Erysipelotrichia bacterium]|nr:alkaline phosphatase family protein [Erysipelotrichia bacterium]